jgi:hypothetical protein
MQVGAKRLCLALRTSEEIIITFITTKIGEWISGHEEKMSEEREKNEHELRRIFIAFDVFNFFSGQSVIDRQTLGPSTLQCVRNGHQGCQKFG